MPDRRPSVVSLYSGAGGLDEGFRRAEFDLLWAADSDEWAVETYRRNLGGHIVQGCLPVDVSRPQEGELRPPRDLRPDVVIGGPPCQGFSVIGRMKPDDPRSRHIFAFMDWVELLEPRAFVMENVKALAAAPRWRATIEALRERADKLKFTTELFVLNAAHFDVPQARERMFLVGMRRMRPLCPVKTTPGRPPTVGETLRALPPFGQPGNDGISNARVVPAQKPVMRPTAYRGSLLFNGSGRPLDLAGPAKTLPASMGGNATPIIDQRELADGCEPWVVGYHADLRAGLKPLKTAPPWMRRLTVQEAAALQTFSDWTFCGPQVAQYRQIGNAVPPNLAFSVAASVRVALDALDRGVDGARDAADEKELALTPS